MSLIEGVRGMVFSATLNSISDISLKSGLLVEETRLPGENHPPAANHRQTWSHYVVSSTPRLSGIRTHNFREYILLKTHTLNI